MIDLESNKFQMVKNQIKCLREQGKTWEEIKTFTFLGPQFDKNTILSFFQQNFGISIDEWTEIVDRFIQEEKNGFDAHVVLCPSTIIPSSPDNDYCLDDSTGCAWISYKRTLKQKGFDEDAIEAIENSSHNILNKLSLDTSNTDPIKGLVVGNVQSGKTANMAALIAMAADQGWNLFIILSGTIENLRIQTQDRLIEDLKSATNVAWVSLNNVKNNPKSTDALSKLIFGDEAQQRYLLVCLKNSTRLKNLLNWLASDTKTRSQLKILFIDDEADQAGVNSAKKTEGKNSPELRERTKINSLLGNLFTNKDGFSKIVDTKFHALDYVAYTATPYANILDERPSILSLYPSNFVATLSNSNLYFGPQQIFGVEGTDNDGMNIINNIPLEDVMQITNKSVDSSIPCSLEKALLWFFCCFAIQRSRGVKKSYSMLIHTSQKQKDHERIAELIKSWFIEALREGELSFIEKCKRVYEEQTSQFTKDDFKEAYPNYGRKDILDYPEFSIIVNELVLILQEQLQSIKIDDNEKVTFSRGVHLCIDNCSHNYIENNEHIRLLYPKDDELDFTTGFIVIGGATLSRGLTINGLVCSYFLRTVTTADTLMQMGRWFGYRKGYELLPRIWMTQKTKDQFVFLSTLDLELRQEFKRLQDCGVSPSLVGPKLRANPKKTLLGLTARNKQKDAYLSDISFAGVEAQTTCFFSDENNLKTNYDNSISFINSLGTPEDSPYFKKNKTLLWKAVDNKTVVSFLTKMEFPKRGNNSFVNLSLFTKWYKEISLKNGIKDWNVVVSNLSDVKEEDSRKMIPLDKCTIYKVRRSRKDDGDNALIRIGALRNPKDLYADIDQEQIKGSISEQDFAAIKEKKASVFREVRNRCGLNKTSLLVIYFIDSESEPLNTEKKRIKMNTPFDVVGLFLYIPENEDNQTESYISCDLSGYISELYEGDINDSN